MDAVSEEQAGTASGINNAVSRTAGLLAIAVFGVVILHAFSYQLAAGLSQLGIDEQLKNSVFEQRVRLAGLEIPKVADASTQQLIKQTVAGAFVSGFRLLMLLSAGLALASALSSWLMIGNSRRANSRQP
jgi:preprotein translocase subunit SecF